VYARSYGRRVGAAYTVGLGPRRALVMGQDTALDAAQGGRASAAALMFWLGSVRGQEAVGVTAVCVFAAAPLVG
jgi:hypothetical protein